MSSPVSSFRYPFEAEIADLPPGAQQAHRNAFNGILDLNQAVSSLKSQIDDLKTSSSSSSTTTNVTQTSETTIITPGTVTSGAVNNQTGQTAYTVQQSDNAGLVVLDDASAIAVTLNSALNIPFYVTISNQGASTATITPTTGLINGAASFTLNGGTFVTLFLDGTNWFADAPAGGGGGGSITSVVAGTGLTGGGSTGAVTVALATPVSVADGGTGTATPGLVAGTNITITGSWPDQTINATGGGGGGLPVNDPTFTGQMTGPHYAGNGAVPSIVVGAAAGGGASASLTSDSTDAGGQIQIITGTGTATGTMATVTFSVPYATQPRVIISPATPSAIETGGVVTQVSADATTSGFTLEAGPGAPQINTNYMAWNYIVLG